MLGITAPLMALCIPLLDVGLCIVRRWLRDQPIFAADRGHIHHRLLDRGLTPRQAVMILYAFCGLAAAFSLVQSQVNNPYLSILVVVVFVALVWTGIHSLNYAEFMLATRLLRIGELKRGVHAQLTLSSFERALLGANSMDGCWAIITGVYRTFGFAGVRIIAGNFDASEWPGNHHAGQFWVMTLPVGDYGRLELAREFSSAVLPACAVPFAELVAEGVTRCLAREREAVAASDSSVVLQAGS
jgi:UDP-GlcNAc:undecaprenyl-phosphate GlcNAc-1-phosphate transferase